MATHAHPGPDSGGRRRVLRIGVLLGGKIVEERLIRERVDVTLGQSAKNTFSIPVEGLPRQWTLFQVVNGQYVLNFTKAMDGRLSDGDRVQTLELARSGGAASRGDHWTLPLSEHARGKVSIGELTLLFQFVTEPPRQPKPMLPHSVRGTLADRLDPQLMVILAVSIVAHTVLMMWAVFINDPDLSDGIADRAAVATFQEESYEIKDVEDFQIPQEPAKDPNEGQAETAPPKGEETKTPEQPKTPAKPTGGGGEKPSGREETSAVALQEESVRYADMLFSGDSATGGVSGDMERRKPGSDLGQLVAEVAASGARTEIGGGQADRGTRGSGDPRIGTGKGPAVEGPGGPVSASGPDGKGTEKVPAGRISVSDKKTFDDSTLTPDAVLRKIMSAYMTGIKRCQKELLKTDPTARGKVKLAFTVNESGRTVSPNATGFESSLDKCIEGQMANWRFDVPKDKDGDPTEASFEISLQLVPE